MSGLSTTFATYIDVWNPDTQRILSPGFFAAAAFSTAEALSKSAFAFASFGDFRFAPSAAARREKRWIAFVPTVWPLIAAAGTRLVIVSCWFLSLKPNIGASRGGGYQTDTIRSGLSESSFSTSI